MPELGIRTRQNSAVCMVMELFIHQQNLLFFRKQLAEKINLAKRLMLLRLLAEEEAKDQQRPKEK